MLSLSDAVLPLISAPHLVFLLYLFLLFPPEPTTSRLSLSCKNTCSSLKCIFFASHTPPVSISLSTLALSLTPPPQIAWKLFCFTTRNSSPSLSSSCLPVTNQLGPVCLKGRGSGIRFVNDRGPEGSNGLHAWTSGLQGQGDVHDKFPKGLGVSRSEGSG